ncbi:TonB-dependent receptor plug domain-containing protein [Lysobacter solisilvae (ex Woo and Kim 2020)]|uniref:TonB-dependent receptor n=1 Tax=Agrilutibacter terrestris TaxID=2865112 RepID=A0A7H0G0I3_9GAMM|nr:TonB-dependent receptor [Lysobacter terrestris]QNP41799.1 TonB-dependent receptor [Lysobacter terrestris]
MPVIHRNRLALAVIATLAAGTAVPVFAQESPQPAPQAEAAAPAAEKGATTLETVSVLGSRTKPRTEATSAVPIDIIGGEEFHNQPAVDVLDKMRTLIPSFNVSTIPIDDAASLVRPANLRGLPPDNTLILVNGKRRHRAAVITFLGHGLSDGSQGPDISVFPSMALEQVEVLRDGAAAQYGSDAIAGVINFGLKRIDHGGTVEAFAGEYYEGDGFTQQYGAQVGLPLTANGFATLTAEWRSADPTSRSVQRDDAAANTAAGYPGVADPAQVWGSPETHEDMKFVANFGISGESVDFYGFGNYAKRDVEGGFYYRDPTSRGGVYSNDGGDTLLIGDLNTANAVTCPTIALRDGSGNLLPYAGVAAAVAALPAECFTWLSQLPGGFTPHFGGRMEDSSLVLGVKGVWGDGWHWDLSGGYGKNEISFYMLNTINSSMGPSQPAENEFAPGGNTQTETNFNFDVAHDFETGFTSGLLSVAMGAEWRKEEFEISAGDYSSYAIGPLTQQGFSIGSNGFPGFNPTTAGSHARDNWALYVDVEAPLTEQFRLAAAVRHEDYEDFGGTTNWKLTGRYDFTEAFAVRGAVSTGFRAPTPGQSNVSQVTTAFIDGELRDTATLPPTLLVGLFPGAEPLKPEESKNASLGLVWNSGNWLVTADAYRIEVTDRIARSTDFDVTQADRDELAARGHPELASLSRVGFFVNDFDTTTSGVDLVASYDTDHFGGKTTYSLAANWNKTEVDDFTPGIISAARVKKLEESLPRTKGYLSVNHQRDVFHANARVSYYGSFYEDHLDSDVVSAADGGLPIYGGSAVTVDAEIGWKFASGLYVDLGAQNLFDKVPDENPWGGVAGAKYPVHAPYGFNGGFYYGRIGYKF